MSEQIKIATFAAGCFWGVEDAFRTLDGVLDTTVGFTGGQVDNPTYQQVGTGKTGHAEAVMVTFDPDQISYEDLLDVFWRIHNPTALRRQIDNPKFQYRSAIFYHSPSQKKAAMASKNKFEVTLGRERILATEISPAMDFYQAEPYHQQYYEKRRERSTRDAL